MSIHHLNCATLKPFGFVISDTASIFSFANLVVHCLLIQSDDGLILIDSGYGIDDRKNPEPLLNGFMFLSNSSRDLTETAYHQIQSLGYDPANVKHIVQSHLHLDHAGGIPDFPQATIHVHRREYNGATNPQTFTERLCVSRHWENVSQMQLYDFSDQSWFGLPSVRVLPGVYPEIYLIHLPGHTPGHCGVAIKTETKWLFHCADAYISRTDIDPVFSNRSRPRWIQPLVNTLFPHISKLSVLLKNHGDEIDMFCAHDPFEFEMCKEYSR